MKFVKKLLSSAAAATILLSVSCSSVSTDPPTPNFVQDTTISWDGNEQNSGILDYVEGVGYILTPAAAELYTQLTEEYGPKQFPPIKKGEGLAKQEGGENYILTNQYMVEFMVMNSQRKSGIDPDAFTGKGKQTNTK